MRVEVPPEILPYLIGVGFLSFLFMGLTYWALIALERYVDERL